MSHDVLGSETVLPRKQARRLSRQMAAVGVDIPADRLIGIAAGAPATDAEIVDIRFAFTATEIRRDERHSRIRRRHRRMVRWLLIVAMTVAALNFLLCLGYAFFNAAGSAGSL